MSVSEVLLSGTAAAVVLSLFFLLRLFRDCVVGLLEPGGTSVVLGGVELGEKVIKPHTLCWLAWSSSLLLMGGSGWAGRCRG